MSKGQPPGVRITQKDIIEGTEVDFTAKEEYWNIYECEDGTTLKVKLVLRGIKRLKKYRPDLYPIYVIDAQNIVRTVNISAKFKAKVKESSFKPV
ncbi:hypothetical protein KAH85_03735 [Candidatus Bathyarchaeota archaeon]|nr:hypothetical protein [Candidatus Bathyarchaeota archaeon]